MLVDIFYLFNVYIMLVHIFYLFNVYIMLVHIFNLFDVYLYKIDYMSLFVNVYHRECLSQSLDLLVSHGHLLITEDKPFLSVWFKYILKTKIKQTK